ncbi:MAG: aspartate aminotransferase family protein [Phenylobacterium sp.]|uniref:aspartate aminotransferase family protein n=1 Tax=Phenylobacterium sp. TaxID=1871053 RepID=UPI001210E95B|nr:aspartate aminotransferase family protein [Phenylobacterium sp.]TAJ72460.1 MAG: aspartate aminotransferase family protein [Phenylobacterium sp.]
MNHLSTAVPNSLDAYWMPFTPNRRFKASPRMVDRADGMHYFTPDGRKVLDGVAGLWCVNAGHNRPRIVEAVQQQAAQMGYATNFNLGHPRAFEFASRVAGLLPGDLDHVFFTNSGSEAVDTALKIALAYQRARGKASKTRLIGRERGYHGVGFGGISVGGIVKNRMYFGTLLAGVDHLPHTHDLARNAFSRGQPQHGAELADALERIVALHDASTIAAVIVEPVAGSTGVLAPPVGYLQRLRALCDKHDILLIFDEVITGFGRLGAPFAAARFEVQPDLVTMAKGITNGLVPMGAVGVRQHIHDTMMDEADAPIELFHGYTYSGHPLACAAGLATLDTYRDEGLFERAAGLEATFEDAVHSLRDARHVIDIRNIGLVAGIELEPRPGEPGERGQEVYHACFDRGLLVRVTGDIVALSPALIVEPGQIDEMVSLLREVLATIA